MDKDFENKEIETHPWPAFIPHNARVLFMGTFPPARHRWSMEFFYPNVINDFWRIMGLIFFDDKEALFDVANKKFRLDDIKSLLTDKGIAMSDTVARAHRQQGNASDKYLEIIEPVNLDALMQKLPDLKAIATTGEKAADVIASLTATTPPKMGEYTLWGDIDIWRMPSTSRAYPMKLEAKASYYRKIFEKLNIK